MKVFWLILALLGCSFGNGEYQKPRKSQAQTRVAAQDEFQNPRKVEIQGYSGSAMEPFISCDERYLFFNNSNAPASETDIFYAERVSEDVFRFLGKVPGLNAPPPALDGVPSMDDAGNLFFVSSRSYDTTLSTLYSGVFRDGQVSEVRLAAGSVSRQQLGWLTMDAEINRDGSLLYFANARFTGGPVPAEADLGLARRSGEAFQVTADSGDLFRNLNTGALEYAPSTSRDGLDLYFTRFDGSVPVILKSTRATPSAPFSPPEPVSAISGFVEAPSISCDGSSLYYHSKDGAEFSIYRVTRTARDLDGLIALPLKDQNGKLQVFTITPDGTNKKQLTFEGENGRPDWSPDGRKIAFSSIRDGKVWLAVMDADGSNQQLLVEGTAPDWAPDGKQIAFSRPDGPDDRPILQIWVIDADGSNIRRITQSNTVKVGPSWSPDGREMVFILIKNPGSQTDPQPEIGIMNSDGTNERILTSEDRMNIRVEPDGRTTVCETANDANAPAWSPVDNRITFWSGIENQYGQVWVINSDGTGSKQLTEDCSHRNSDDPSWSPDGKKILFSTGRSGGNELWVMDADGSNEKRVSDIDAFPFPGRASWQPVAISSGTVSIASLQILRKGKPVDHLVAGAKAKKYQINLTGSGFTSESKALIGGAEAETLLTSSAELTVKLPFKRVPDVGALAVEVRNTGGQVSNSLTIEVRKGF